MGIEARLKELGIELPAVPEAAGNYVDAVQVGNLLFCSGKGPRGAEGKAAVGKVGRDVTAEEAYRHAREVGLILIAVWKQTLGDLDRVKRVVRLGGFVACTPDFTQQPQVINGASDLAVAVFGEKGKHARAAVGCPSLPGDAAVEVEGMFELA